MDYKTVYKECPIHASVLIPIRSSVVKYMCSFKDCTYRKTFTHREVLKHNYTTIKGNESFFMSGFENVELIKPKKKHRVSNGKTKKQR